MKLCLLSFILSVILAGCQDSNHLVVANPAGPNTALARQLTLQAHALIQQEKYDDAEPLLHKAVDADPMFGPARNNLGLVYFRQQADEHAKHSNSLYMAAWEFENAIKLMPYQPEPRNNLGLVMEAAGKLTEAAVEYQRARKMQPDNPEFIGNLARVKIQQGARDEETKQLLQELTFKDPRPEWRNWAREELIRFYAKPIEPALPRSTTGPATEKH